MRMLVSLVVVGLMYPAAAEPPGLAPSVRLQSPGLTDAMPRRQRKSTARAYLIAISAVAVPGVVGGILADDGNPSLETVGGILVGSALVLGPSAGHWYVGDHYMTTGLAMRGLAVAGTAALVLTQPEMSPLTFAAAAGIGLLGELGIAWDLWTLRGEVRRHNARTMALVPIAGEQTGVVLAGRF